MEEKYAVYYKNGIAHLSDDNGRQSLCGKSIAFRPGWGSAGTATAKQFVETYRPRCKHCRLGMEVKITIDETINNKP